MSNEHTFQLHRGNGPGNWEQRLQWGGLEAPLGHFLLAGNWLHLVKRFRFGFRHLCIQTQVLQLDDPGDLSSPSVSQVLPLHNEDENSYLITNSYHCKEQNSYCMFKEDQWQNMVLNSK